MPISTLRRVGCQCAWRQPDLADYLVLRGVPFREAHGLAGRAVKKAIELGVSSDWLPVYEWKAISPLIEERRSERVRLSPHP